MASFIRFRRDLALTVGSSGIGFALTLVTTPIMTRIFPAEAYGANGMALSAATLVSGFGLLGLPVALARTAEQGEQRHLLNMSLQLSLVLAVVCMAAALVLLRVPAWSAAIPFWVTLFLPLMVLSHCAQRIADSLMTARGQFSAMSASRIAYAVIARVGALLFGWLIAPVTLAMVAADALGKAGLVGTGMRMGLLGADDRIGWRPKLREIWQSVARYRDYALQSNVASALPLLTTFGLQSLLAFRLGMESNGRYVLATSIIALPVSLIALASAPVVFHRLLRTFSENPGLLPRQLVLAMLGYLACGAVLMAPLYFFGPPIFGFFFGQQWTEAGEVAAILAIPQIFAFSLTGVIGLLQVVRANNLWLGGEAIGTLLVLGGAAALARGGMVQVMSTLAMLQIGYQIVMHGACLLAAHRAAVRHG